MQKVQTRTARAAWTFCFIDLVYASRQLNDHGDTADVVLNCHLELRARVKVGERVLNLQAALAAQFAAPEDALARERQLQALLPICPSCKRIRADGEYWHQVDLYVHLHARSQGSPHGICPSCFEKIITSDFQLTAGSPEHSKK